MLKTGNMNVFLNKTIIFGLLAIIVLGSLPSSVQAQGVAEQPIARRDIVIDLGDGLKTDAQLTFPAVGKGPFPGVLLVHGSGSIDMDAYFPPAAPGEEPVRLFLQQAEYLSERGFAVLRYNKRGVGLNGTIIDQNVWKNMTFQDLVRDAETAVETLRQQPEVDANDITVIGHSEGTMIAPRIAVNDPSIRNIVLMGVVSHNLRDVFYWQLVDRSMAFAESVMDTSHDGLISIQEVLDAEGRGELSASSILQNSTGTYDWIPGIDANKDGYFSIHEEWEPLQIQGFILYTSSDPTSPFYSKWLQSDFALEETNLDLIGNVSASILILNGENDIQTPVQEAFLLEQKLTEVGHPDHTLITYPCLGHTFYPAKGLVQPLGSIQEYVLADLTAWLKDPARTVRYLETQILIAEDTVKNLQSQLTSLNSELKLRTDELQDIQKKASQLTDNLNTANQQINDLKTQLAAQIQRLTQELQTAKNETKDVKTTLTSELDKANQQINSLQGKVTTLQSQSSNIENTITELQSRNNELQTALNASTILAYIAIIIAVVAIAAAVVVATRRHSA